MQNFKVGDLVVVIPRDEVKDPEMFPIYTGLMEEFGNGAYRVADIDVMGTIVLGELDPEKHSHVDGFFWNRHWLFPMKNED